MARWERSDEQAIPDWFWSAVDTKAQQHTVEVEECDVAFQSWGDTNKPGLLFVHGMSAHKHWWDFIAPSFINDYNVVAMDLTGMGDSDFRYEYDSETYSLEIASVCKEAGLTKDAILVGHSFGGRMAVKALGYYPDLFRALVLVDSGLRHPEEPEPDYPSLGGGRDKIYPSREAAEARFRLYPPQPCDNQYLLTYIARKSVVNLDGAGWGWKFDAELPLVMKNVDLEVEDLEKLTLPIGIVYGANSLSFTNETLEYTSGLIQNLTAVEKVEDAQHHVFLDQPLTFTSALARVLHKL